MKLWNPERGACLRTLAGHQGVANSAGFLPGRRVGAPLLGRPHGERMHLLLRFEKGKTLALCCPWFSAFYTQKRRVQHLLRFEKGETIADFFMAFFCFVHTPKRRAPLLLRFEEGETLAIFSMAFRFLHSQKRRVQFLLRFGKGKSLANFVHGSLFFT